MADYTTEERDGHLRTTVQLELGERVSLCRCFGSAKFPFCDGTRRQRRGNVGPVIAQAPQTQTAQ